MLLERLSFWFKAEVHKFSKIMGARSVTRSKFHSEDPEILDGTLFNRVTTANNERDLCTPGFKILRSFFGNTRVSNRTIGHMLLFLLLLFYCCCCYDSLVI